MNPNLLLELDPSITHKFCYICKEIKPEKEFHEIQRKLTHEDICKSCYEKTGFIYHNTGKNNPNYGKFGKEHPCWGFKKSEEKIEKISGSNSCHWKGGIGKFPYPFAFDDALKERIKTRDNFTCQLCFTKQDLNVHHLDYNKDNLNPNNLVTLCNSDNGKANYNRDKWKAFFRELLKKKYGYDYANEIIRFETLDSFNEERKGF